MTSQTVKWGQNPSPKERAGLQRTVIPILASAQDTAPKGLHLKMPIKGNEAWTKHHKECPTKQTTANITCNNNRTRRSQLVIANNGLKQNLHARNNTGMSSSKLSQAGALQSFEGACVTEMWHTEDVSWSKAASMSYSWSRHEEHRNRLEPHIGIEEDRKRTECLRKHNSDLIRD